MTKTELQISLAKFNQEGMHNYPFKTVAFVKASINGKDRWLTFVVDKNKDLQEFIDRLLEPARGPRPDWSVTPYNYKYTAFHEKTPKLKEFTMDLHPNYLVSHSSRRGWFNKASISTFQKFGG